MSLPRTAKLLGTGYAHLQHGIDRAIDWGFRRMKRMGDKNEPPGPTRHPVLRKVGNVAKGTIGFLGTAGDAYFRTYETLKEKRKDQEPRTKKISPTKV